LYFVVRVRCRRKESSRSLFHLLMSFLFTLVVNFRVINYLRSEFLKTKAPVTVVRATFLEHNVTVNWYREYRDCLRSRPLFLTPIQASRLVHEQTHRSLLSVYLRSLLVRILSVHSVRFVAVIYSSCQSREWKTKIVSVSAGTRGVATTAASLSAFD